MPDDDKGRAERTYLDIVLYPHRSFGPRGFIVLMTAVVLFGCVWGLSFAIIGAWPVLPFFGCEFLLIYFAFRLNYRAARVFEAVRLTDDALTIERTGSSGKQHTVSFRPPHWLRVELVGSGTNQPRLCLHSHGRHLTIGGFLSGAEKIAFAGVLREALSKLGPVPQ